MPATLAVLLASAHAQEVTLFAQLNLGGKPLLERVCPRTASGALRGTVGSVKEVCWTEKPFNHNGERAGFITLAHTETLPAWVDSLENDLQAWPEKIRAAQAFADRHDPSTAGPIGPRAKSQAQLQEALRLHEEGLTIGEIAQRFGLVPKSLKRAMARQRKRSAH